MNANDTIDGRIAKRREQNVAALNDLIERYRLDAERYGPDSYHAEEYARLVAKRDGTGEES